ncbi:hypothetical protein RF11_07832 [Thelohanellus kitauei]|uniref:CUB domain-containing protein n=1 Tax=Thelohanellus kitauei TaxID=669202 RepID=A0A0C2N0M0_THEKT|nr:hypothetical protein RF11_07832 [Thelohanellus kitauei]
MFKMVSALSIVIIFHIVSTVKSGKLPQIEEYFEKYLSPKYPVECSLSKASVICVLSYPYSRNIMEYFSVYIDCEHRKISFGTSLGKYLTVNPTKIAENDSLVIKSQRFDIQIYYKTLVNETYVNVTVYSDQNLTQPFIRIENHIPDIFSICSNISTGIRTDSDHQSNENEEITNLGLGLVIALGIVLHFCLCIFIYNIGFCIRSRCFTRENCHHEWNHSASMSTFSSSSSESKESKSHTNQT